MSLAEGKTVERAGKNTGALSSSEDPSRPIYVDVHRLMELFQLTDSGVRSLVRKGIIPKPATGRYFFDASITGYVTYLRKYAKGRPNWDDDHSGSIDRSRLLKAKADIEELKAKELGSQLINVNDVAEAWSAVTVTMRNRLLAIPARAAPLLVGENALEVIQGRLEALIHEALTELSSTRVEGVDAPS